MYEIFINDWPKEKKKRKWGERKYIIQERSYANKCYSNAEN